MITSVGPGKKRAGRGFTLVELLLAVALILLLLGGIMLNFSALKQGADLEEGAAQFESLLRFARSHAASSGRQVRLRFEPGMNSSDEESESKFALRLMWEPDPVARPGVFEELPESSRYIEGVSETVRIISFAGEETPAAAGRQVAPSTEGSWNGLFDDELTPAAFDLHFFPDGSSESAEIVLASRDPEDRRRVAIFLTGVTGAIKRERLAVDEKTGEKISGAPISEPHSDGAEKQSSDSPQLNSSPDETSDAETQPAQTDSSPVASPAGTVEPVQPTSEPDKLSGEPVKLPEEADPSAPPKPRTK